MSRAEDGPICRRKLTSLAFKGEDDPSASPAAWIVGEPVERAVQVLEQLQAGRDTYLFAPVPGSAHDLRSHATSAKSTHQTNDDLAAFTDWVSAFCQHHGRPDGIPLVNGQRWRLGSGLRGRVRPLSTETQRVCLVRCPRRGLTVSVIARRTRGWRNST